MKQILSLNLRLTLLNVCFQQNFNYELSLIKTKCIIIMGLLDVLIKDNSLSAYGLISRELIKAEISPNQDLGIRFIHPSGEIVEANALNVFVSSLASP